MPEIHLTTREAILYLTLIGIGAGIVMGLVPLIYGWMKGKKKLAIIAMIVSIVAGAIWIVLPLLSMIIFIFLIARRSPLDSATLEEPAVDDDNDTDSVV